MAKLYIIRHAETEIDPAISSTEWKLKPAAHDSLLKMSKEIGLRDVDCIFHSPLPKAKATAAILGEICGVSLIERQCLKEVERHFHFIEQETFRQYVLDYLSGIRTNHFEEYSKAKQRITQCISGITKESGPESFAVVSHGMILSVLFHSLIASDQSPLVWQKMKMPDFSVIDLEKTLVVDGLYSGHKVKFPLATKADSE